MRAVHFQGQSAEQAARITLYSWNSQRFSEAQPHSDRRAHSLVLSKLEYIAGKFDILGDLQIGNGQLRL